MTQLVSNCETEMDIDPVYQAFVNHIREDVLNFSAIPIALSPPIFHGHATTEAWQLLSKAFRSGCVLTKNTRPGFN